MWLRRGDNRTFISSRSSGLPSNQCRYAIHQDRKCEKLTPCNGEPVQHMNGKWFESQKTMLTITRLRLAVGTVKRKTKSLKITANIQLGVAARERTHYEISWNTWTEQWTVTTHFDGTMTETLPVQVGWVWTRTIDFDRERAWIDESGRRNTYSKDPKISINIVWLDSLFLDCEGFDREIPSRVFIINEKMWVCFIRRQR
jgi:hypothetical protein